MVGSGGWLVGGGDIPSHALHCRWSFDGTVVFVHQNPEIVTLTFLSFLPEPTVPVVRRTPPVGCCQPQPGRGAPVRAVLFSFLEFRGTKELWLFHPRLYCPTRRPKCPLRPRYFQSYLLTPCSLPFWGFLSPRPLHPPFLLGTLCGQLPPFPPALSEDNGLVRTVGGSVYGGFSGDNESPKLDRTSRTVSFESDHIANDEKLVSAL